MEEVVTWTRRATWLLSTQLFKLAINLVNQPLTPPPQIHRLDSHLAQVGPAWENETDRTPA